MALAFDINGGRWFTDPEEMLAHVMPLLADPDRIAVDWRLMTYGGALHAFHHPPVDLLAECLPLSE